MTFDAWLDQRRHERAVAGLSRSLSPRSADVSPDASRIDLAGNDYLGLNRDPRVTRAAADAALLWGAGAGASRLVTGTLQLHTSLETRLADFSGHASALVFSSGYLANLGAVAGLTDADTLIVSDAHVHASLVDSCRLAKPGGLTVVAHNDVEAVASALRNRSHDRALVLVESVYSVLGDAAPLAQLAEVTASQGAVLIVDEAHAIGVSGIGGRGRLHELGLAARPDIVATVALSKALGSQGGAVLGSTAVVEHLVNSARPFIYDTGLAPAATGAALAALALIEADPDLPARARAHAVALATGVGVE
ncbi:MAG: aminotransferase class I/II-fold pyridoxal phosphate-dependent enzyme, partial [Propionibacteriales bacterium]|nr:aminotransferase class I/II-fold pyridoxal phosphate-dependent enzyme [Propionibacteriales bacterium]